MAKYISTSESTKLRKPCAQLAVRSMRDQRAAEQPWKMEEFVALELDMNYRMRWMDFDRYGRVQPWALLDLFQDAATLHADELGIGRNSVTTEGVFWAVIRSKYEIVREPKHHQAVRVHTWPHSLSRFSFIRDYSLLDEGGDLLVKATTEWVLMDVQTRKFVSAIDYYKGPRDFSEARSFEKKPRKAPNFTEGNRPVRTVVPSFCDIDVNGHVNNAMYARYIVDAIDPGADGAIKTFQVDYRQEALLGMPLAVHTLVEDRRILGKGVREDGDTSFGCLIELA